MNKIVPHQINYSWLKYTAGTSSVALYISAIISLIILGMELFQVKNEDLTEGLNKGLAFISIGYFIIEFCQSYIFHKAESLRNLDFVDNSFGSKFAEKNSSGYYSNDEIEAGIIKMGINGFENAFFTKKVTAKMLNKELRKFVVVVLLFLVCVFTSPKIVVAVFQMTLPLAIIQQTIKLYTYNCKVGEIFFNYKSMFTSESRNNIVPSIIKNSINYEKAISWAGIPLDSKIFNDMNGDLSEKWSKIKEEIRLQVSP